MPHFENDNVILQDVDYEQKSNMILTVPNIISFVRILLIVPFIVLFVLEHYIGAFGCILLSGISDCLDGILARKLNQISSLGKLLDPIADKLTLVAVVICLGVLIPEIFPLVVTLVIKDVLMLAGGYYLIKKGITPPQAKWYGKVATTIFYISVVSIVFYKAILGLSMNYLTTALLSMTMISMMFALVNYSRLFIKLIREKV